MWITFLALLAVALARPSSPLVAAEGRVVTTTERGICIEGRHDPLQIRRLPGTAVSSAKPRNPSEDSYLHCREAPPDGRPAAPAGAGTRH